MSIVYIHYMKIIILPLKIKGLIFDIDQTLYDNREYYEGQKDLLVAKLAKRQNKSFEMMLKEVKEKQAAYAAQNNEERLSLGNLFLHFGISIEENCAWRTELFEPEKYLSKDKKLIAAMEVLSEKYKIAAVTNTSTHIALRTLKVLGVIRFFPIVIGLDRTLVSKPTLLPFAIASKEMQIAFKHLVSIGDRMEVDVEFPVKNGMGGILVECMEDIYRLGDILETEKKTF